MIAYTEDGRNMPYDEYRKTDTWKQKRAERIKFDDGRCVICRQPLTIQEAVIQHWTYRNVGHEDVSQDLGTLCNRCHAVFHETWGTITSDTSQLTANHWEYYSKEDKGQFFVEFWMYDMYAGGKHNACARDEIRQLINEFYRYHKREDERGVSVDDVQIFFRNRRLESCLSYIDKDRTFEDFLSQYGPKGKAGTPNKLRSEAQQYFKKYFDNPLKARKLLDSAQYKYIENLWDSVKKEDWIYEF